MGPYSSGCAWWPLIHYYEFEAGLGDVATRQLRLSRGAECFGLCNRRRGLGQVRLRCKRQDEWRVRLGPLSDIG
jgi:hypothetical protein